MSTREEVEVLSEALDYLSDPEHWQNRGFSDSGRPGNGLNGDRVCMWESVARQEAHPWSERKRATARLRAACVDLHGVDSIFVVNDRTGTTHEDVLLVLKHALHEAESELP